MTDVLAFHLLRTLVRKGVLDLDDIETMAADIIREDEDEDAAMAVRGAYVEAHGETEAMQRRAQFKVVPLSHPAPSPQADGGNAD